MIRQKSFSNEMPTLYLVPTPIGNLEEMSPRAIEILRSVDIIAAEDTRNTMKLLQVYDIHTRLIAHHSHNERESAKGLLNLLEQGHSIAVVSDAGYPLISDPGQNIVEQVTAAGYNVVPVSGCSASINALVASGLKAQPFLFKGFLASNDRECVRELESLKKLPFTMIFYEAPHRIERMLGHCLDVLGDRRACLAREMTKKHEEFIRGTLSEIKEIAGDLKGEMVIVIEGCQEKEEQAVDMTQITSRINERINLGMSASEAIKQIAKESGVSKNEIYRIYHQESQN